MIKVGILTFHNAHNYGAILQAYGLRTFLRRNGYQAHIVNYSNAKIADAYPKRLPYEYTLRDFKHIRSTPKMVKSLLDTNYAQKSWENQWKKFNNIIQTVILEGEKQAVSANQLSDLDYDAYIAGSDQIWNKWLTDGLDPVYFLDFKTTAKKIFYGASSDQADVSQEDIDYYKTCLNNTDAIATREKELAESLTALCGRKVEQVLDPTLLIDADDYSPLMDVGNPIKEKYLFAYFVVEDQRMMNIAQFLARVLNLKLIELHYYLLRDLKHHDQFADFGPSEFLHYIKNADFVVTNSFHGTVFSVIFQRQFYSVYDVDARKQTLLEMLHLKDRHIARASDIDLNQQIDYHDVGEKLKKVRASSEKYLLQALANDVKEGEHGNW